MGMSTPIVAASIIMTQQDMVDIRGSGWKTSTLTRFGGIVVVTGTEPGSVSMIEKSVKWYVSHYISPVVEL